MSTFIRFMLVFLLLAGTGLTACRSTEVEQAEQPLPSGSMSNVAPVAGHNHAMGALSLLPPDMRAMPERTEEAYLFSVANQDLAQTIPCYCGCVGLGHVSSYDCYVAEGPDSGAIVFDAHAMNCGVCVDITQDAMRLLDEGHAPPDIRAYIDETYSIYGPGTPLEMTDHSS